MRPALQPVAQPQKFAINVPGRFAVNSECIDCDLCRQTAPTHFVREKEREHSYVQIQPRNDEEIINCRAALEICPVNAIVDALADQG